MATSCRSSYRATLQKKNFGHAKQNSPSPSSSSPRGGRHNGWSARSTSSSKLAPPSSDLASNGSPSLNTAAERTDESKQPGAGRGARAATTQQLQQPHAANYSTQALPIPPTATGPVPSPIMQSWGAFDELGNNPLPPKNDPENGYDPKYDPQTGRISTSYVNNIPEEFLAAGVRWWSLPPRQAPPRASEGTASSIPANMGATPFLSKDSNDYGISRSVQLLLATRGTQIGLHRSSRMREVI